jgi:hypothetical protein
MTTEIQHYCLLGMILWNHWGNGPTSVSDFSTISNSDFIYWITAFFGINLFLFMYIYTGLLKNSGINFGWNIECFIHALSNNIKFSIISLFLIPKSQYFSFFCFDQEIDKLWAIYIYFNEMSFPNFGKYIKSGTCDSILKSTHVFAKSLYEKNKSSINDDLFKIEKYINNSINQCSKSHWVFGLMLMLIYLFFINNILEYYPIRNLRINKNSSPLYYDQKSQMKSPPSPSNTAIVMEND